MIRAFIFDLDGTLVETEMLKARAYAAVSQDLLGLREPDHRAIDLYRSIVGATDETAARAMVEGLGLADALAALADARSQPWEALETRAAALYDEEFATGEGLRNAAYGHTIGLLRAQAAAGTPVAVATSSNTTQARRVTGELGVGELLDVLVGRDQVVNSKPHPEIYLKTAELLGVRPEETVVIEDSATGLESAVRAGTACIAVASAFSAEGLRAQRWLDQEWCVYDPAGLPAVVERRVAGAE